MQKIKELYTKYEETILYLFFGGCTTLVNFISYYLLKLIVHQDIANAIAWFLSITFAYITNKTFVFKSKGFKVKEIAEFFLARVFSLLVDQSLFMFLTRKTTWWDFIIKFIITIITTILNYILSKFIIFKKKGEKKWKAM